MILPPTADQAQPALSAISFVRYASRHFGGEDYMAEHLLCRVVAGEMRLIEPTLQHQYRAGDTVLLRRHHMVKCEKQPVSSQEPFQAISLALPASFLQAYARHYEVPVPAAFPATESVRALPGHPILDGLFQSLGPYLGHPAEVPGEALTSLKLTEAVMGIVAQDAMLAGWLFNFSEPGKADLVAFMHRHFIFNLPIERFAELAGRSVSTFQRDFRALFGQSPGRWLLQHRLEAARLALRQPGKRPSEVYLEVGFEDLAHFSRSYRKAFGYSPSQTATGK